MLKETEKQQGYLKEALLTRFLEIERVYSHWKFKKGEEYRAQYNEAQIQLFNLAQGLGKYYFPALQAELDESRRAVMLELTSSPEGIQAIMAARKHMYKWTEFQITPGVANDPYINGRVISIKSARRLITAHKKQIQAITNLIQQAKRSASSH